MTQRWDQRDRKRDKKNLIKQMNSFEQYEERDDEKAKELSRKKKLYKKQEEELLDVFDKKGD